MTPLLHLQRCLTQSQSRNSGRGSEPGPDEQQYTGYYSRSVALIYIYIYILLRAPECGGGCRGVWWRLSALSEIKVRRELNAD